MNGEIVTSSSHSSNICEDEAFIHTGSKDDSDFVMLSRVEPEKVK